jgi:hypothetical protein
LLRRVLPVAGAAALALVPSTAWAAPADGPVDHYSSAIHYGSVDAQLPDGRRLIATLYEVYEENHHDTRGFLNLQLGQSCAFVPVPGACAPAANGWAELTGDQIEFDRGLRGASLDDVTLTLWTPAYYLPGSGVPGGLPPGGDVPPGDGTLPPPMPPGGSYIPPVLVPGTTEVVTVDFVFTGTGAVSRNAEHVVADCGWDSTGCQSTRLLAERTADVTVTLGWESGVSMTANSNAGQMAYAQAVDAAAFLPAGEG